jgi:hypothetical protein
MVINQHGPGVLITRGKSACPGSEQLMINSLKRFLEAGFGA